MWHDSRNEFDAQICYSELFGLSELLRSPIWAHLLRWLTDLQ